MSPALLAALLLAAPDLTLEWDAPPDCPRTASIAAQISTLSGRPVVLGPDAPLRARALVRRQGPELSAELHLASSAGVHQRTLSGERCADLAGALALILALALDDAAALPAEAPTATVAAPPLIERPGGATPAPSLTLSLGAQLFFDPGSLPSAATGASLLARGQFGRWSLLAGASLWLPQRSALRRAPEAGADTVLYGVRVLACARLPLPLWLEACAGGEWVRLEAEGYGVRAPLPGQASWVAPLGALALALPAGEQARFRLGLEAAVPWSRPRLVLEGVGEVHHIPAVVPRACLGLELEIP